MIRINLLPYRAARKRENIRRQISIFFLSFVLVGVGMFSYNLTLNGKISRLNATVDALNLQLKANRKKAEEVDQIKKALNLLDIKLEAIRLVKKRRREPVELLEAMTGVVIPKRMWFNNFSANNQNLSIKGMALDQKTVADFMIALESTRLFSGVNLSTLRHVVVENMGFKSFEIVCDRAQPAVPSVKQPEKKK